MGKNEPKRRLVKITLTAVWKGRNVRKISRMRMGMLSEMSDKTIKDMVKEMREKYRKTAEVNSFLYPDAELTVRSCVSMYEVDFFLRG